MTLQPHFYNRYIPPPDATATARYVKDDLEDARPAKKRRKHEHQVQAPANDINDNPQKLTTPITSQKGPVIESSSKGSELFPHTGPKIGGLTHESDWKVDKKHSSARVVERQKQRKKTKQKKRKIDSEDTSKPEGSEGEPKHVNILSKYQQSVNLAAKSTEDDNSEQVLQHPTLIPSATHGLTPIPQPPQVPDAAPVSASSALPAWLSNPLVVSGAESVQFDTLPLDLSIQESLKAKGFTNAFSIQAAILSLLLPSKDRHHGDLCIAAPTGSGKTLAYALPMVEALRNKSIIRLRGLIVVPTRELVNQTREIFELFRSESGLKVGTAHGGKSLKDEQKGLVTRYQRFDPEAYQQEQSKEVDEDEELLKWDMDTVEEEEEVCMVNYVNDYASNVDILICTPGRLVEHLQQTHGFDLHHVEWFVIDEADRLLDGTLQRWVDIVLPALEYIRPPSAAESQLRQTFHLLQKREVQKIILSATMTRDINTLKELKLKRPKLVVLRGEQQSEQIDGEAKEQSLAFEMPSTLQEVAIQIKDEENKPLYLIELLKKLSSTPTQGGSNQQIVEKADRERQSDASDDSGNDLELFESDGTSSSQPSSVPSVSSPISKSDADTAQSDVPVDSSPPKTYGSLIFAHSTSSAHRLSRLLSILSPAQGSTTATLTKSSAASSGRMLSQYKCGKVKTIISTDRASRGLDINLAHVINYDMPPSVKSYIHRVGRTARAGNAGTAITLVGWREGRWFWNEIGRGQSIHRGSRKITRQTLKEQGWGQEELQEYAEALKQLGDETRKEQRRDSAPGVWAECRWNTSI